jgi:identified by metaGeneAnnotator|nr:MAG TPA: terminase small subunit [Caudoviricetes sp.]
MHDNRRELEERICEMLAQGHSMAEICRRKDMPAESTVYKWLAEGGVFSERYAHAREQQADLYADEIIEIADNCPPVQEEIAKAKVRIDARKWKAARLAPKKYGDRLDVNAVAAVKVESRSLADIFTDG